MIPATVRAPLDDTPQDLVDECFCRVLQNINNPVPASSHLVRSLPLPSAVLADPLSLPPQFQDILILPLPSPPPTALDPVLLVVNLLDEAMQPLFTVPPAPSSNLEAICDQILMPHPPALKKGGSVWVIPGKQKGKLNIKPVMPINVYAQFCLNTAKSKFSLVSPVAD